jgi:UDP-N-acetylmuramoylalanine--D-glutamate ligase
VLELSSFQLDWLPEEAVWPRIAVVTNCTPNHLDWHGSFDGYFAAKQRLLRYQTANSAAVLNVNDPLVRQWQKLVHGRLLAVESDCDVPLLRVPGQHNRHNAALAAAAAIAIGCSQAAIADALATFRGLPHRLELVAEVAGRRFYNDSMATTPESVVAAVETFAGGWFLVGGHDKGFDFTEMAARLARGASGVACFGAARDKISAIIARQPRRRCAVHSCETLVDALAWCWSLAQIGDAIVLSPACASYDQFRDYRDRGEKFIALTRALADRDALSAR